MGRKPLVVTDFLAQHGRMPRVGDDIPPWHYRGWLGFYVQEIQRMHPAVPDRWGYLYETIARGRFLDQPIPKVQFTARSAEPEKNIEDLVKIASSDGAWTAFSRLVDFMCYGLGVSEAVPDLSDEVSEALYRKLDVGPWLLHPWDYLGEYLSITKAHGFNPNAFYPTPHPVVEAMVSMAMADVRDARNKSVCDPCMGTGRMLLHASNYSMFLFGQDIDEFVLKIAKINGALYAPWMICPPPKHLMSQKIAPPIPTQGGHRVRRSPRPAPPLPPRPPKRSSSE